jgi:aminoglycoside phosphotransferase
MLCCKSDNSTAFRTVSVNNNNITTINEKGELYYDYAYLGVAGVLDYEQFWNTLEFILQENNTLEASDCHIFKKMLSSCIIKTEVTNKWYDTGNIENLIKTKSNFSSEYTVLDKHEESIYFLKDDVIKFFHDTKLCKDRVARANRLNKLVPEIISSSSNFYKYKKIEGDLLSHTVNEVKIIKLVDWAIENLWYNIDISKEQFKKNCIDFYYEKTLQRVEKYFKITNDIDCSHIINGINIPSCNEIFKNIDWENLYNTSPVQFHGDFILENILQTPDDNFMLIDWRQNFGGIVEAGDKYYDLSKLNHNLVFNHDIVANNNFVIQTNNNIITCDILRSHKLVLCQQALFNKLQTLNIDIKKIKILTCIIWLNMAPLHIYPLNKFLFYFGKYNLWREICRR